MAAQRQQLAQRNNRRQFSKRILLQKELQITSEYTAWKQMWELHKSTEQMTELLLQQKAREEREWTERMRSTQNAKKYMFNDDLAATPAADHIMRQLEQEYTAQQQLQQQQSLQQQQLERSS